MPDGLQDNNLERAVHCSKMLQSNVLRPILEKVRPFHCLPAAFLTAFS